MLKRYFVLFLLFALWKVDRCRSEEKDLAGVRYSPPMITLVPCGTSPRIDGRLDAQEWGNAAIVTGFLSQANAQLVLQPQPSVYLTFDEQNIYIGFISPIRNGLVRSNVDRDSPIWLEDSFEVYLDPGKTEKAYFHLGVNANGACYDARGLDSRWNGHWAYRYRVENGNWTGEIAIPFSELGVQAIWSQPTWGFNIARNFSSPRGIIQSSLAYLRWGHTPSKFGKLIFRKDGAIVRTGSLGHPLAGDIALQCRLESKQPCEVLCQWSVRRGDEIFQDSRKMRIAPASLLQLNRTLNRSNHLKLGVLSWSLTDSTGGLFFSQVIPFLQSPLLAVEQVSRPSRGTLDITADISNAPPVLSPGTVRVRLEEKERKKLTAETTIQRFDDGIGNARFDLATLLVGQYTMVCSLLNTKGTTLAKKETTLYKPNEVWKDNKLGISDQVPSPWPAMTVHHDTIECWGRQITAGVPVASQILSQGEPLLDAPIQLIVHAGGQQISWKPTAVQFKEITPAAVIYQTTGQSPFFRLSTTVRVEFDGLMKVECRVVPIKPTAIDKCYLEIPLPAARTKYLMTSKTVYGEYVQGYLPEKGYASGFHPYIWLADDRRGLCWLCETNDTWQLKDPSKAIEVTQSGTRTLLRLNIIDHTHSVKAPYTFVFGLHPTPVKPFPRKWRTQYRWLNTYCLDRYELFPSDPKDWEDRWRKNAKKPTQQHADQANVVPFWPHPVSYKYFGFPEAKHPDVTKRLVEFYHGKGIKLLPYVAANELSAAIPEYSYYGKDWIATGDLSGSGDVDEFKTPLFLISPLSRGWGDFIIYKTYHFVKEFGFDGIYVDWAEVCIPYRTEEGKVKWPLFADRELRKRMYVSLKSLGPDVRVVGHVSSGAGPWTASFYDALVSGEERQPFKGGKDQGDTIDRYSLGKFAAEFCSAKLGLPSMIFSFAGPNILEPKGRQESPACTEALLALAAIHDVMVMNYTSTYDPQILMRWWKIQDRFGMDDVDFRGYWEDQEMIRPSLPETKVSMYVKRDRSKVMLVIANLGDRTANEQLHINLSPLTAHQRIKEAVEAYSREKVRCDQGTMNVSIPRHSFRVVVLNLGDH